MVYHLTWHNQTTRLHIYSGKETHTNHLKTFSSSHVPLHLCDCSCLSMLFWVYSFQKSSAWRLQDASTELQTCALFISFYVFMCFLSASRTVKKKTFLKCLQHFPTGVIAQIPWWHAQPLWVGLCRESIKPLSHFCYHSQTVFRISQEIWVVHVVLGMICTNQLLWVPPF